MPPCCASDGVDALDPAIFTQLLISGLLAGALYALLACGLNLVFGVMRIINLAHAEFMLVGAFGAYVLYATLGIHPLVALVPVLAIVFAFGWVLQRWLVERVVGRPLLTSLLLTYAVSIILINIGIEIFSSDFKSIPELQGALIVGDLAVSKPRTVAGIVALVVTFAVWLFLERSRLGKAIRATSEHAQVASICGIDVVRIRMLTMGLAAVMAATAGVMLSMIYSFAPETGADFIQRCFAIIVLGGMGNFVGALIGGLLLGIVESYVGFFVSTQWAEATAYLLLVTVLLLRPTGLRGVAHAP